MAVDHSIRRLAERQYGLVSRRQLNQLGISWKSVRSRLANGMLEEVTPRVLRVVGGPDTLQARLLAATLHVNSSIISHATAAALWGIAGFHPEPIHLAVTRNLHRPSSSPWIVHHATVIPEEERRQLEGIPLASPGLTLVQLAATVHPGRLERAVDNAWSLRLVELGELRSLLESLARQGRNGVVALRRILDARSGMERPPQSNLESRFLQIMRDAGVLTLRPQVNVGGERWTGRVDFCDSEVPLIVEIQSERYHSALSDRRADEARHAALRAEGFVVVTIWDTELFRDPAAVVERVVEARRRLVLGG